MARESTTESWVIRQKKIKGFPMFFTLENFKTAFVGDMELRSSRHYRRRRRRRYRRHRRS
jgi:hypothetical protein